MNMLTNSNFSLKSKVEKRDLTVIIPKITSAEFTHSKPFTTADMWNLQRRSRTMLQRRRNA